MVDFFKSPGEAMSRALAQNRQLKPEQRVLSLRARPYTSEWEPATVVRVNQNGTVRVCFEDGHQETKGIVRPITDGGTDEFL